MTISHLIRTASIRKYAFSVLQNLSHTTECMLYGCCYKAYVFPNCSIPNYANHFMGPSVTVSGAHVFSTMVESVLVQACNPSQLSVELEKAVDSRRFEAAWKLYEQYMYMGEGFPRKSVLNKVINGFAESSDLPWIKKAYDLVELVFNEGKHELLERDTLIYLSFILARSGSPVLASTIMRKTIEQRVFLPVQVWSGMIGHMAQSETGAYLASELVNEIGYLFKDNRVDPRKKINLPLLEMKPNAISFRIALTGCLLFGFTRKAEVLLELMPRIGLKSDTSLLIVMARIYEKNGHIEELKKLKRHIDDASHLGDHAYIQFYDCLLSCHLKFGNFISASEMVLDMLRKAKEAKISLKAAKSVIKAVETNKFLLLGTNSEHGTSDDASNKLKLIRGEAPSFMDFSQDRSFLRLEGEAKESLDLLSEKLQTQVELVRTENGILHPTEKLYAKLVRAFLEADKVTDLTFFLIEASKEDSPVSLENSAVVQIINACISLGWLERAHDLLDEMKFSGVRIGGSIYSTLLKAYCKANRPREITALLKEAQKAGIQLDSGCYEAMIETRVLDRDMEGALHLFKEMKGSNISKAGNQEFESLVKGCEGSGEAKLMSRLLEEIKDHQTVAEYGVHDWNSVIHFFCKKRLMGDAQKALVKMRALGHHPNVQTFHSLVTAYAAIGGKYLEVTELWGEMKLLANSDDMKFDQELLDGLLYCFVRGGFFSRANEVVKMLERGDMFVDKYKYRNLWLKYHRTLYRGKVPKIQTVGQIQRREAALAFKRWLGFS